MIDVLVIVAGFLTFGLIVFVIVGMHPNPRQAFKSSRKTRGDDR